MTMASYDQMSKWRLEGMAYAYAKIKQDGFEAFEKELAWRVPRGCALLTTNKDVKKFELSVIERIKDVVAVMSLAVLNDEFDFDAEQLERFRERFGLKCECINEKYLTWDEQAKILKDEKGIEVEFRSIKA